MAKQPVIFIAVNSGTPPAQVAAYVRRHRIIWPVIVDVDRSFERACGIQPPVSLQNIWQVRILTPDGRLLPGSATNLEASAQLALQGAAWNVDPEGIPPSLHRAWQAIEFGRFSAVAKQVRKAARSRDPATRQGAEKLLNYVHQQIQQQLQQAQEALQQGRKWTAYRLLEQLLERFAGYELPPQVREQIKTLARDPELKTQRAAWRMLQKAQQLLRSPRTHRRGEALLERVVKQYPQTEAAQVAQQLLGSSGSGP